MGSKNITIRRIVFSVSSLIVLWSANSHGENVDLSNTVSFANQDTNTGEVTFDNETLYLEGNRWQATQDYYSVTENTVLEFEFATDSIGQIHGIGLDEDNSVSGSRIFKLAGTQSWGRRKVASYTAASGEFQKFRIPVGKYYQGDNMRLVLVNDNDVYNPTNSSLFRNVRLLTPGEIVPEPPEDNPSCISPLQQQLLDAHNRARASGRMCGDTYMEEVAPLSWSCTIAQAATNHSRDMATNNFFSHTGSDGLSPFDRMTNVGYVYWAAGENIAAGYDSVESVVNGWLNSPGHCSNIMSSSFTEMGGAMIENSASTYRLYWTTNFGRPR